MNNRSTITLRPMYQAGVAAGGSSATLSLMPYVVPGGPAAPSGPVRYITVTAAQTLHAGDQVMADTTSGAFQLTLPASPVSGDWCSVSDAAGTWGDPGSYVDVAPQATDAIDDLTPGEVLRCDVSGQSLTFVFNGAVWRAYIN